jgi:heat shock protein HslJ
MSHFYCHQERKTRHIQISNTIIIDGGVELSGNHMRGITLCLILFSLILGCSAGCLAPASLPEELTSHTWRLISYNNGNELADVGPLTIITLKFSEGGQISGTAGCNDYFGTYNIDGALISVRALGATEKYCLAPKGVMDMEQAYFLLLGNTTRYSIDQDEMTLSHYDEKKLLIFRKQ